MRTHTLAVLAIAGAAVPTAALASSGADDPPGHDRTTTVQTTTTTVAEPPTRPSRGLTAGQRAAAIRAAKARVGSAVVIRVLRRSHAGYEVRLRTATVRIKVRLNGSFKVTRVQRELLRQPAATTLGASDDGTPDQGRGDAPGTAPSGGGADDDGTPDQGRGDAPGTAPSGGGAATTVRPIRVAAMRLARLRAAAARTTTDLTTEARTVRHTDTVPTIDAGGAPAARWRTRSLQQRRGGTADTDALIDLLSKATVGTLAQSRASPYGVFVLKGRAAAVCAQDGSRSLVDPRATTVAMSSCARGAGVTVAGGGEDDDAGVGELAPYSLRRWPAGRRDPRFP